ncbi:MAG: hypothetical protein IKR74_05075 [Bacilli bacterium]|nr:hypothetical protein [Bacilli bacterium]
MEKRNTLLLTVIAIATLLVAVVGATFAYFANSANVNNVANLTATTASSSSSFISTGAEIKMNVTAANMVQANGTSAGNLAATSAYDSGHFNVTFTAGTTESLTCTYKIKYQWDTGTEEYTKTTGITGNEFTYKVTATGNANFKAETQIVNSSETSAQLVGSDSITDNHTTGGTTKEYTIETKFYNFNVSQNDNSGKTWKIKFFVDEVQC